MSATNRLSAPSPVLRALFATLACASAGMVLAAEPPPDKPLYAEGRMLVLVAPTFPKDALAKGETAKVEVFANVRTDGRLEGIRIESTPPLEAFESAVMDVVPLWRLQPRIADKDCGAYDTKGHVTLWFEIDAGQPKVSYGTHVPAGSPVPEIHVDRNPVKVVKPLYPASLARNPNAPPSSLQIAYVAVADDGAVTGVTVAPMLYYRDFEPLLSAAIRQWKFEPRPSRWCAEVRFDMSLQ